MDFLTICIIGAVLITIGIWHMSAKIKVRCKHCWRPIEYDNEQGAWAHAFNGFFYKYCGDSRTNVAEPDMDWVA